MSFYFINSLYNIDKLATNLLYELGQVSKLLGLIFLTVK